MSTDTAVHPVARTGDSLDPNAVIHADQHDLLQRRHNKVTDVSKLATGGAGTAASPWTGWESQWNALPAGTHCLWVGVFRYTVQLVLSVDNTTQEFVPGARLLKGTALAADPSFVVTAANTTFIHMDWDGVRASGLQTVGISVSGANCRMFYGGARHNRHVAITVTATGQLDLYGCDVSDNVHSTLAGWGVTCFGRLRTDEACRFNDNGYGGVYVDMGGDVPGCEVNGHFERNGYVGAELQGYEGRSRLLDCRDNGYVAVAVEHAFGWELGVVRSADGGKTAAADGIGLQFKGAQMCHVGTLQVARPRGFGLCFSRRAEVPTVTVGSDPGSGGTTVTVVGSLSGRPTRGGMVISNEYITYTGISGQDLTGCVRGQRNTTATAHPVGREVFFLPGAVLTADPGSGGTTIAVATTTGFPAGGFLWVGDEVATYSGKTSTSFTGVKRGQLNTTAAAHAVNTTAHPFLESYGNQVGTYTYDGYGHPDSDPAIQISGGSSFNQVHSATVNGAIVAVSIGEEPWPKSNDNNEIDYLYAKDVPDGVFIVTGGNNNRIRRLEMVDCQTVDSAIADALIYFNDQRANLSAFGYGTVTGNRVDSYEARNPTTTPPTKWFSQLSTASGNVAHTTIYATATWNPGSVAHANSLTTTVTGVTKAAVGDVVRVTHSVYTAAGVEFFGTVYAADSVVVHLLNMSGSTQDPASGTLWIEVVKHGA